MYPTMSSKTKNVCVIFCGQEVGRLRLADDQEMAIVNSYLLSLFSLHSYFDTHLLHHLLKPDSSLRRLSITLQDPVN